MHLLRALVACLLINEMLDTQITLDVMACNDACDNLIAGSVS